jgi:hypothetical protein
MYDRRSIKAEVVEIEKTKVVVDAKDVIFDFCHGREKK